MTDEEFDAMMARAANPNLIPGIYNYCDRRCERCRFAERCFSHLESRNEREAGTLDVLRIIAERQGIDLSGPPDGAVSSEREEEQEEEGERRALADPIVALGKQYAMTTWPITRALWPIVMPRGDDRVIDALETIESLSSTLSAKVFRAVWGTVQSDFDAADLQSDSNGSAKVSRLLIAESRRAWLVLMEQGRATANGVPARLVNMLDQLDAAMAVRFPRAMEFVRPGFDTERAGTSEDRDPALAVAPVGHA